MDSLSSAPPSCYWPSSDSHQPIHSWNFRGEDILLYFTPQKRLEASFLKQGHVHRVDQTWIEGIPSQASSSLACLQCFLRDTYLQVSSLGGGEYTIRVLHPLKGGAAPETNLETRPRRRIGAKILEYVQEAVKEAKKAHKKHVIAVIGNTGAGKSTLINDLMGVEMEHFELIPGIFPVRPKPGQKEIAPIGHGLSTSKTLLTTLYDIPRTNPRLVVADCGGFLDTRETEVALAVPLSIMYTLQNAESVRLVICFDYNELKTARGQRFIEVVRTTLGVLVHENRIEDAARSLLFLFTRTIPTCNPITNQISRPNREEIVATIREFRKDPPEGPPTDPGLRQLFDYVIRENGRYVHVYNPVDPQSSKETLQLIHALPSIQKPREAFNVPYANSSAAFLIEEISAIEGELHELYTAYTGTRQSMNTLESELKEMKEERAALQKIIQTADKTSQTSSSQALRAAYERTIKTQTQKQTQQRQFIERKEEEIRTHRAQLQLLDQGGDHEESFWEDEIEEGARFDQHTKEIHHPATAKRVFLFFKRKVPGKVEATQETPNGKIISRTFSYVGPPFTRVELTPPATNSCWTDRSQGQEGKEFSIRYSSAPGQPASARIKVFVKKRDLPTVMQGRLSLLQEIQTKSSEITRHNMLCGQATQEIQTAQTALQELKISSLTNEMYQAKTETFNIKKEKLESKIKALKEKLRINQDKMHGKVKDAQFLKDYLDLCGDTNLRKQPSVQRFFKIYPDFLKIAK